MTNGGDPGVLMESARLRTARTHGTQPGPRARCETGATSVTGFHQLGIRGPGADAGRDRSRGHGTGGRAKEKRGDTCVVDPLRSRHPPPLRGRRSAWVVVFKSRPCNPAAITIRMIRRSAWSMAARAVYLMVICLGRSAAALRTRMVRTPSLRLASISLSSTSPGNAIS
jgi:hypothetical protein